MIGVRTGNFLFSLLVMIGQGIFAFGVTIESYPICLLGRGVFGLGGESLIVSENYSIMSWFTGKDLSMAIGSSISAARLGSVINDNTEPAIVSSSGSLALGLWVGLGVCAVSLLSALLQNMLDKRKDKILGISERTLLPASEKFKCRDMQFFGLSYWLLSINCLIMSVCVFCFNNIASNFFQKRFQYNSIEAGSIISITFLTGAILCPVFGRVVDKIGRRVDFIVFSNVIVTLVHVCFLVTPDSHRPIYPIFYMVLMGLGHSIYSSVIWASIPYLVIAKIAGTAFGMTTAIQNFGLGVGPLFVGYFQENTTKDKGYFWVSFFFVIVGALGVGTSIMIYINDLRTGGVLHSSHPVLAKASFVSTISENEEIIANDDSVN